MPTPEKLTVHLSAVTPLFLGGADPNERAELRPPSIKGLLRYWYRVLDGEHRTRERRLFGSTYTGQAPCLLSVSEWREGTQGWEGYPRRGEIPGGEYTRPMRDGGYQIGGGPTGQNGIVYAGYSLTLGKGRQDGNDRKAIPAETTSGFDLYFLPRPKEDTPEMRCAWLAGLWLLVHVGGVGTRSRRGLGSLRIEEWDGWSDECKEFGPLPCLASTPQEWKARMEAGLATLWKWFPNPPPETHQTVVSKRARFLILTKPHRKWEDALNDAGLRLQQFRQRKQPDYNAVKAYLNSGNLATGPERAGFGLPLAFRYGSLRGASVTFAGNEHGRMASPLLIRVVKLGNQYHAAFVHLPAPFLSQGERVAVQGRQGSSLPPHPNTSRIIKDFLDTKVKPDALEVTL